MHTQVRRALAPLVFLLIFLFAATSAQAATFAVTYTNAAGQGFFDPTVGAARRAAFEASLSNWSQHLGTSPVPINVKASFDSLGGSTNSATLGQASPTVFFHDFAASDPHYQAGVYYAKALANHLAARELDSTRADIMAQFNSDVGSPSVLPNKPFYYGTDAQPGNGIDFYSVALHEVGHGLGFTSLLNSAGSYGGGTIPSAFDLYLTQGADAARVRLTSQTPAQRAAAEISGNLFFDGARTQAANGGAPAKMFAPNPYQGGSSVSHLDEATFSLPNLNELLTPVSSGPIHDAGPVGQSIFYDMGWNIPPFVSSITRLDASPTSATTERFAVAFTTPVTGVDPADFAATTTGSVSGATVTSVTGSGLNYVVTVSNTGGSGTLRLDLVDNDSITDANATPLGGAGTTDASGGNGSFTSGQRYALAPSGTLLGIVAVNAGNSNVVNVDAQSGTQSVITSANPPLINSYGVARASDGTLYVSNFSAPSVVKISPAGTPTTLTTGTNLLSQPLGIAVGPDGFVYVANNGNNGIIKVDPASGAQTLLTSGVNLSGPRGLTFGSDGQLYVGNNGAQNIIKVNPASGAQIIYATAAQLTLADDTAAPGPWGLAFGSDGTLYVDDDANKRAVKVPPGGGAATALTGVSSLSAPYGLTYASDGNLYIADGSSNTLKQVTLAGAISTITTGGSLNNPTAVASVSVNAPTVSISALGSPDQQSATASTDARFLLALSGASTQAVTVQVTTADGTAIAGEDYVAISAAPAAIYTFSPGSTTAVVTITVKPDPTVEPDETFSASLSNPTNATLGTASATFTIKSPTASAATSGALISQFRYGGPGGAADEFIELANTTNAPLDVNGWTVSAASGPTVTVSGTIPANGHLLLANSGGYSLGAIAAPDVSYTGDIPLSATLTLKNALGTVIETVLGSVAPTSATAQHAYIRRLETGAASNTGNSSTDFNLVDTAATVSTVGTTGVGPLTAARLGSPNPHNTLSTAQNNAGLPNGPINIAAVPSAARYASKGSAIDTKGRLSIRRTITNNTGAAVSKLRFRIVAITSGTSTPAGAADLRAISSGGVKYFNNGTLTQAAVGLPIDGPTTPIVAPLTSTSTGNGGGLNASWTVPLPGGTLAAGATVNVEFLFGIKVDGPYRVVVDAEMLP